MSGGKIEHLTTKHGYDIPGDQEAQRMNTHPLRNSTEDEHRGWLPLTPPSFNAIPSTALLDLTDWGLGLNEERVQDITYRARLHETLPCHNDELQRHTVTYCWRAQTMMLLLLLGSNDPRSTWTVQYQRLALFPSRQALHCTENGPIISPMDLCNFAYHRFFAAAHEHP